MEILFLPPITFAIVLIAACGLSLAMSRVSFKRKSQPAGTTKPYACGEDMPDTLVQPDYSQFFPFAFFFTILHVTALVLTTVPAVGIAVFGIALVYIAGAVAGLSILYRK